MRKIKELMEWLKQFPADFEVWGYEGEVQGIVVGSESEGEKSWVFHNRDPIDKTYNSLIYPQLPDEEDDKYDKSKEIN